MKYEIFDRVRFDGHVRQQRAGSSITYIAAEMQVTRRVSTGLRFAVIPRKPLAAWPVAGASLQVHLRPKSNGPTSVKASPFSHSARANVEGRFTGAAKELHQKSDEAHKSDFEKSIAREKEKQTKAPWHREGSNVPPVARPRSAGAMTKGTS